MQWSADVFLFYLRILSCCLVSSLGGIVGEIPTVSIFAENKPKLVARMYISVSVLDTFTKDLKS